VPVSKRRVLPLVSGRIRLRLLQESDLLQTLAWRNQEGVRRWFFYSERITPGQHSNWYAEYVERDDDFVFIIEEIERLNKPVGQVALYHVDWAAGRAEFGRLMIGEQAARGQGLARVATTLLVDTALSSWGLREVYLEVYTDNQPALAIYDACGFRVTGTQANVTHMAMARFSP
jgi:diamine N-acetyltransferase